MAEAITFLPPSGEDPESDRIAGYPHPREMLSLVGAKIQEQEFLSAFNAGRLHHAFLLAGPQGVGKATFAWRAARFLLSGKEKGEVSLFGEPEPITSMMIAAEDRVTTLLAQNSHPDLYLLRRRYDAKTKKIKGETAVEDVREAISLFSKTAAFGGWRIIIVDSVDDLNASGANALLKTIEEPPNRAMIFLISHNPRGLLPTIRSRCQQINFGPLNDVDLDTLLTGLNVPVPEHKDLIARAEGSIGHALRLRGRGVIAFLGMVDQLLERLPALDNGMVEKIAENVRGVAEGADAFQDLLGAIELYLAAQIRHAVARGMSIFAIERLAQAHARMQERAKTTESFNLDRRAFVYAIFDELSALATSMRG